MRKTHQRLALVFTFIGVASAAALHLATAASEKGDCPPLLKGTVPFFGAGGKQADPLPASPDFAREVRPLLAKFCFKCHGPNEKTRKAKFRLDVSGQVEKSELVERITS